MKVFNLAFSAFIMLGIFACGKDKTSIQVPEEVLSACVLKYGDIKNAAWTSVADTVFVSSFVLERHAVSAFFDRTGRWLKSETELRSSELPLVVVQTVINVFGGRKIKMARLVYINNADPVYILSLKRGGKVEEITLSTGGVVLEDRSEK